MCVYFFFHRADLCNLIFTQSANGRLCLLLLLPFSVRTVVERSSNQGCVWDWSGLICVAEWRTADCSALFHFTSFNCPVFFRRVDQHLKETVPSFFAWLSLSDECKCPSCLSRSLLPSSSSTFIVKLSEVVAGNEILIFSASRQRCKPTRLMEHFRHLLDFIRSGKVVWKEEAYSSTTTTTWKVFRQIQADQGEPDSSSSSLPIGAWVHFRHVGSHDLLTKLA